MPRKASSDAASSGPPVVVPVCITCSWRAESVDKFGAAACMPKSACPPASCFAPVGFAARPWAGIHARHAGLRPAIGRCAAYLCEFRAALRGRGSVAGKRRLQSTSMRARRCSASLRRKSTPRRTGWLLSVPRRSGSHHVERDAMQVRKQVVRWAGFKARLRSRPTKLPLVTRK